MKSRQQDTPRQYSRCRGDGRRGGMLGRTGATIVVFTLLIPCSLPAARAGFYLVSPRFMGMGGAGAAVADHYNAFFFNPALYSEDEGGSMRALEIRLKINQNVVSQYQFYRDHEDQFKNLDQMTEGERHAFYQELLLAVNKPSVVGIEGVAPMSVIRNGYSLGFFVSSTLTYDLREGAAVVPQIRIDNISEGEVVLGGSRSLGAAAGGQMSLGFNLKYLYRMVVRESRTAPALETLADPSFYHGGTFSADLGFLYRRGRFALGLAFYDLLWPTISWTVENKRPDVESPPGEVSASSRIGLSYQLGWKLPGFLENPILAADLADPFSSSDPFAYRLSLGGEVRVVGMIHLRLGLHQGYPTVGLGMKLSLLQLDYTFYGEELGLVPGQIPSYNHLFSAGIALWGD